MPMFVCDKCNCLENTALGHYWSRNQDYFGKDYVGLALCSECSPFVYSDGSKATGFGKWHGKFEKRLYTGKEATVNRSL